MWDWQSQFGIFVLLSNDKTKIKKYSEVMVQVNRHNTSCFLNNLPILSSTSPRDPPSTGCETDWIIKVNNTARKQKKGFMDANQ